MATISLRAYYSEIEGMIERSHAKDAIIHCRQILKSYPKSIDTYRLLGKAYLEAQRFSEGADVLQRVLSAVPDDFVSHIGLSIIREDEGNLDGALWHMERAFEAQPSNKAVQDELRRLYGRRDGVQPTKIRLTRGALVRMYARGDLHQQAVAEARMALVEQPDRVDIELILARMYYLSNQKISATEICSRILSKLPFCYEANKILMEILPGTARQDEVEIYKRRLFDLDPYLEFAPPGALSSAEAPEESIMLETLELDEEKLAAEHPELTGEEEERLPDWLAALETKETPADELSQIMDKGLKVSGVAAEAVKPSQAAEPVRNEEDQIPEWMKEAGWQSAEEGKTEGETIPEEVADEIASEADIPEWLQSIAPTAETPGIFGAVESAEEEENTAWLESILEGEIPGDQVLEEAAPAAVVPEEPALQDVEEPEEIISAVEEVHPLETLAEEFELNETEPEQVDLVNIADMLSADAGGGNVPEWLSGIAAMEPAPEEPEPVEESAPDTDWLKSLASETVLPTEEESVQPEGFQPFEFEHEEPEKAVGGEEEEPKIDTDWFKRLPFEEETTAEVEPEMEGEVQPFETEPEPVEEEVPGEVEEINIDTDWLKRIAGEEAPAAEPESPAEKEVLPAEFESELPAFEKDAAGEFKITTDWLRALPEEEEEPEPAEGVEPAEEEVEPVELEPEVKAKTEEYAADEDFLKRLAQEVEVEGEPGAETGEEQPFPPEVELPVEGAEKIEENGADADWLKRLSVEEDVPVEPEVVGVTEGFVSEEPAPGQAPEFEAEREIPEEAEVEEVSLEEGVPAETLTTEEFLSEIEKAIPPEKEATQPTRTSPPPVGGIPIEEFIAQLEAEEQGTPEPQELAAEITEVKEAVQPEEVELTAADLEGILPGAPVDNSFDQTAVELPDWLKESLDIETMAAQPGGAEEIPSLAGIPGILQEKTPEELALEEILAHPEEIPPEELIPEESVTEWTTPEEAEKPEEIQVVNPFEALEGAPEDLIEIPTPAEMEAVEEEAVDLEAEESKELLGWLAEDFGETEGEPGEEAEFVPPEPEKFEWVSEEEIGERVEQLEAEIAPEEAAEPVEREEIPDWLMALAEEKEPQPEAAELKEEAIPEWLKDLEEEPEVEEQPAEEPAAVQAEPLEVEEVPEAVFEADEVSEAKEVAEPEEVEELPEYSLEDEEAPVEPTIEETSPVRAAAPPEEKIPAVSAGSELYNAQAAMIDHDLETALTYYNMLIGQGAALDDIIHDLREALDHYPVDISIWQALGDAYMRNNQLQDALDAYTKAEELMR